MRAAIAGAGMVGSLLVGCVPGGGSAPPPPTTAPVVPPPAAPATSAAPGPHVPVISSFSASTAAAPSPLTTALRWNISDPDGDLLTCALDLDGDGNHELDLGVCTSATSRTRTFSTPGNVTVGLRVSDGTNVSTAVVTLSVAAPSADQYGIALRLGAGMTPTQEAAFTDAVARWNGIVKTGQPDRVVSFAANSCVTGHDAFTGTVDDLLIDAQIVSIDGPGGILGMAGPCLLRGSNGLPIHGVMQFDAADIASLEASGQLANTIVHEMGHVLGIGTVWSSSLLTGAGTPNPRFVGPAAIGAWRELGGTDDVPVENTGGSGTADSHWKETVFRTELMTGYLNSTNQLSALTAASLADLGYGVTLAGVDSYLLPSFRANSAHRHSDGHDHHEHLVSITPVGTV